MIIEQLKRHEGRGKKEPYKCSEGYWTVGFGRNLETNPLTTHEAEFLLTNDVERVFYKLRDLQLIPMTKKIDTIEPRQGVLLNMAFQMGVTGLLKFKKALKAYTNHDYETCAREILDSRYAKQTPHRAQEMYKQMLTGVWQ
jgi:lysozyme